MDGSFRNLHSIVAEYIRRQPSVKSDKKLYPCTNEEKNDENMQKMGHNNYSLAHLLHVTLVKLVVLQSADDFNQSNPVTATV